MDGQVYCWSSSHWENVPLPRLSKPLLSVVVMSCCLFLACVNILSQPICKPNTSFSLPLSAGCSRFPRAIGESWETGTGAAVWIQDKEGKSGLPAHALCLCPLVLFVFVSGCNTSILQYIFTGCAQPYASWVWQDPAYNGYFWPPGDIMSMFRYSTVTRVQRWTSCFSAVDGMALLQNPRVCTVILPLDFPQTLCNVFSTTDTSNTTRSTSRSLKNPFLLWQPEQCSSVWNISPQSKYFPEEIFSKRLTRFCASFFT